MSSSDCEAVMRAFCIGPFIPGTWLTRYVRTDDQSEI